MANILSFIAENGTSSDYWDGTEGYGVDLSSTTDFHNPVYFDNSTDRDNAYSTRVYTSVSSWVSARASQSGNAGDDEYGVIEDTWSSAEAGFNLTALTSADSWILRTFGNARHSGKWSDTAYRAVTTGTSGDITSTADNFTIDGLQYSNTGATYTGQYLFINTYGIQGEVSNTIFDINNNATGIRIQGQDSFSTFNLWNLLIYNSGTQGTGEGVRNANTANVNMYNSTVYNMNDGIERDGGVFSVYNCAVGNCTDDFDGTFQDIEYCCSDDGDDTGSNGQTPSGSDWDNEFTDISTDDFSLLNTGNCYNNGQDNPGSGLYDDDITGLDRTSSWDIGAFEYDDSGPPPTGNPWYYYLLQA